MDKSTLNSANNFCSVNTFEDMRLEFYIIDLLFRHDCVIVPELGAFVAQSYPAELEPSTRMFRPGRKQLAFNSGMRRSDGLLIDYVSRTNAWSYERATQELKKAVRQWRNELAQGKKIRLEYIGQLYTEDGNIQFLPSLESNYQLDSYGMGMFYVHPINALKSAPRSKAKKTQKKEEISFPDAAKASSWRQWRWAAVFIPVLAAGSFVWTQKQEMRQLLNASDAWVASIVEREEPMEDSLRYFEGVQGFPRKSVIPFNDRSSTASFVPVRSEQNEETQLPPEVEKPEPVKEAAVEAVKTASAENPLEVMRTVQEVKKPNVYFIIVGSYKEEANKDKRILELQALGYEAEVAPGRGIHRVSAAGFATRAEAQKALGGIKKSLHKGAWIYRRP